MSYAVVIVVGHVTTLHQICTSRGDSPMTVDGVFSDKSSLVVLCVCLLYQHLVKASILLGHTSAAKGTSD